VVNYIADRVVVMYAGRKVEEVAADRLTGHAAHPYTQGLLRASPRLGAAHYRTVTLTEIPGAIASAAAEAGCPFRPRCPIARADCADAMPPLRAIAPGHRIACPYAEVS